MNISINFKYKKLRNIHPLKQNPLKRILLVGGYT